MAARPRPREVPSDRQQARKSHTSIFSFLFHSTRDITQGFCTFTRAGHARHGHSGIASSHRMGKGYKGKNPAGAKGGKGGGRDGAGSEGGLKKKWSAKGDHSDSDESSEEEESEEELETVSEQPPRRPVPGELPPNSSDESESGSDDESESDDDDPLLNPHARPKTVKPAEPPIEKSQGEREADMENLKLVRERRAKEAADRIAREGYDRFLPLGAPGGPPAKKN